MPTPSSPELARSGHTPVDPDAPSTTAPLEPQVGTAGAADHLGPVPPGNQPAHADEKDQDKPDLRAFARRLGIVKRRGNDEHDGRAARNDATTDFDAQTEDHAGPTERDDGGQPGVPARLLRATRSALSQSLGATETIMRRTADAVAAVRRRTSDDQPTR